ncbi:DNA polymerase IV [Mucilaginibacter corticis]|uniref:DNA polymerase IV n=1 Tax=Mucilaginibacter corticis TaxID=2597670 RepID=A0A556MMM9_9SPHI|nr:DNA polymerase IV [Mucilaginibacter corticis]TSJ41019.1 DNA polymerase IV [Mucilaginibacter corticis]
MTNVLPPYRKIIHIDMDAFYASVEQRDDPRLSGKPLVVGGLPEGRGGVVATASYEARLYGIRSAMPSKQALQLCPQVLFVKPRFDVYKAVSVQIREIFSRYTDLVEPLSLDEAYLDVTHDKPGIGSALEIARQIKQAIRDELHLTASAGVSVNKFVAKIASDLDKPDGLKFIGPSTIPAFMEQLPIEKFHGIGKVTAGKMRKLGVFNGADLKKLGEDELTGNFGKAGKFYYQIVRGIDDRPVQPFRETKSLAAEDTFAHDLTLQEEMVKELEKLSMTVHRRLIQKNLQCRTITLKIKYSNFKLITRSRSYPAPLAGTEAIQTAVIQLLAETIQEGQRVRLLGISLSNFGNAPDQLKMF